MMMMQILRAFGPERSRFLFRARREGKNQQERRRKSAEAPGALLSADNVALRLVAWNCGALHCGTQGGGVGGASGAL